MEDFFDSFFFYFIFIGIPVLFLGFLYFIGWKLESKKTGIILSTSVGMFFLIIMVLISNPNLFFTKNDIKEVLIKNKIELKDDFKVLSKSNEYFQTFTIEISPKDKIQIIRNNSIEDVKTINSDFEIINGETQKISLSKELNQISYSNFHERE